MFILPKWQAARKGETPIMLATNTELQINK